MRASRAISDWRIPPKQCVERIAPAIWETVPRTAGRSVQEGLQPFPFPPNVGVGILVDNCHVLVPEPGDDRLAHMGRQVVATGMEYLVGGRGSGRRPCP